MARVSVASAPRMLRLQEGQSIEQAVRDAVRPNLKFFLGLKVPAYVVKPTGRSSYGQSTLTGRGPVRTLPPGKPTPRPKGRPV